MSAANGDRPQINIIRKRKVSHGSHGGAWKVAYADFVTAMMALFIVLWIIGQSKQVKEYIANYFRDPGAFNEETHSGALSGGLVPVHNPSMSKVGVPLENQTSELMTLTKEGKKLEQMIASTPEFNKFMNQIKITVSKEGLRIELIENSEGLFFDVGSAALKPETVVLLKMIAKELSTLPNQIIIEGYTDARPYVRTDYTNWELSTDRANAARRIMQDGGLRKKQILEVRGYGDRRLRDPDHPYDYSNRRVSILVTPMISDTSKMIEQIDTVKIGGQ
jgi:chemotaxis protein MotB